MFLFGFALLIFINSSLQINIIRKPHGGRNEIKAVVFDMGGVWFSYTEGIANAWNNIDTKYELKAGTVAEAAKSANFTKWCLKRGYGSMFQGDISLEEVEERRYFTEYLNEKYGTNIMDALKPFTPIFDKGNSHLKFKMCYVIEKLKTWNITTGLMTNNVFLDKEHINDTILAGSPKFDVHIESCRVHAAKPDEAIYQMMQSQLGVEAKHILFLDDLEENLEPARKLGWKTLQVEDEDQAISDLQKMLKVKFFK